MVVMVVVVVAWRCTGRGRGRADPPQTRRRALAQKPISGGG